MPRSKKNQKAKRDARRAEERAAKTEIQTAASVLSPPLPPQPEQISFEPSAAVDELPPLPTSDPICIDIEVERESMMALTSVNILVPQVVITDFHETYSKDKEPTYTGDTATTVQAPTSVHPTSSTIVSATPDTETTPKKSKKNRKYKKQKRKRTGAHSAAPPIPHNPVMHPHGMNPWYPPLYQSAHTGYTANYRPSHPDGHPHPVPFSQYRHALSPSESAYTGYYARHGAGPPMQPAHASWQAPVMAEQEHNQYGSYVDVEPRPFRLRATAPEFIPKDRME